MHAAPQLASIPFSNPTLPGWNACMQGALLRMHAATAEQGRAACMRAAMPSRAPRLPKSGLRGGCTLAQLPSRNLVCFGRPPQLLQLRNGIVHLTLHRATRHAWS
jgi:hypothetical protein